MNEPYPDSRALRTSPRSVAAGRQQYAVFVPVQTRFGDNDIDGHVSNVAVHAYFDSSLKRLLIERGALDIVGGTAIGLVVETRCEFFAPVAYPQPLEAGIRVTRVGASSVCYQVALFAAGAERASAQGYFVHVYIDRHTRRPQPLCERLRLTVEALLRTPE